MNYVFMITESYVRVVTNYCVLLFSDNTLSGNWKLRDMFFQYKFDFLNANEFIVESCEIDSLFKSFEEYGLSELDSSYLKYTKSLNPKYDTIVKDCKYYKVNRNDLYKFVVNKFRIKNLVPKDKYYIELILGQREFIYLNIRIKVLHKLLELQNELKLLDHDYNALKIISGYRHPYYNELIGGSSLSWHIGGAALDISVEDVGKNGKINKEDKRIILDILDNKVIKDKGGIGKYPGTRTVHFDVRGYKARW